MKKSKKSKKYSKTHKTEKAAKGHLANIEKRKGTGKIKKVGTKFQLNYSFPAK